MLDSSKQMNPQVSLVSSFILQLFGISEQFGCYIICKILLVMTFQMLYQL